MYRIFAYIILFTASFLLPPATYPQIPPTPPTDVRAFDTPNDAGRSVTITWKKSLEDTTLIEYEILRFTDPEGEGISTGPIRGIIPSPRGEG